MVTLKTLVDAQQVIDRLLAMHLEAVLQQPDCVRKMADASNDRKLAYMVSNELRWAIAPMLAKEVEIHE